MRPEEDLKSDQSCAIIISTTQRTLKMPPQVKATLTLPFAIAVIAGAVIVLTSHPAIFIWGLMGISSIAILGSLWYFLFVMFGGKA
jgi:hypothetical protein